MKDYAKPLWWPECPYSKDVFTMELSELTKIIKNDKILTAISGCLGRYFWTVASNMIYESWIKYEDNQSK